MGHVLTTAGVSPEISTHSSENHANKKDTHPPSGFSLAVLCLLISLCLIVLAVFYGWSNFANSIPELQPWHEDAPAAEFTRVLRAG